MVCIPLISLLTLNVTGLIAESFMWRWWDRVHQGRRLPTQAIQLATSHCAFRGFVLERCSHPGKLVSNLLNLFSIPCLTCRGSSNIPPTKINPNHPFRFNWFWSFTGQLDMDVKHSVLVLAQLGRSGLTPLQLPFLVVGNHNRDVLTTAQQGQANRPILFTKRKNSGIVISRSWVEFLNGFTFGFCCFTVCPNPGTHSDRLICAQPKLSPNILIDQTLNCGRCLSRCYLVMR